MSQEIQGCLSIFQAKTQIEAGHWPIHAQVAAISQPLTEQEISDIYHDVMESGYWINLCFDIQSVWNYCEPGSDKYKKIKDHEYVPDYADEIVEAIEDADKTCSEAS